MIFSPPLYTKWPLGHEKLSFISNSSRGPSKQPNETDKKKVSDKVAPFLRSVTCKLDDVSKTRF